MTGKAKDNKVSHHRNPEPSFEGGKNWGDYALGGRLKEVEKRKEVIERAKIEVLGSPSVDVDKLPDDKKTFLESKIKEIATRRVYDEHFSGNIERGMYNPAVINQEMMQLLEVTDEIPEDLNWDNVLESVDREVNCFTRHGLKGPFDDSGKVVEQKVTITNEQRWMLMKDIEETLDLYRQCYRDSLGPETVFKALRHMARMAIYQTYFDKGMLTGSDHGVLHAHHNCGHSDKMHDAMDRGDMPVFGRLLVKLIHYYHDIGYSVGASDFSVKKDHPFIGAGYIDANRSHFEECLPLPSGSALLPERFGHVEPVAILRNVILNHANISFDSDPDNLQKLIMFTVTNSDACAVSMDEKSQAVWRENPELLVELMRLQKFTEIHPKYSGFSRLGADELPTEPEKALKLKKAVIDTLPEPDKPEYREMVKQAMAQQDSFEDPDDFIAYQLYEQVRGRMFKILEDKNITLTASETAQFQQAITNSLTGVGSGIVVGQYAVKVDSVKCTREHDEHKVTEPKYQPHITLRASREAKLAGQVLGEDKAIKNTRKLCEEYKGQADQVAEAVKDVVQSNEDQEIKTAVATITIAPVEESKKKEFENKLQAISEAFLPEEIRSMQQDMNQLLKKAVKNNFADDDVNTLKDHISKLQNAVDETTDVKWHDKSAVENSCNKLQEALSSDNLQQEEWDPLLSDFNSAFMAVDEHRFVFKDMRAPA